MIEKQYVFRRKLQVTALALGAIAALLCYMHKAHAHVDLVHVEVDSIVREILNDMHESNEQARRECAGWGYERDCESIVSQADAQQDHKD